jgi:hypothetical protein
MKAIMKISIMAYQWHVKISSIIIIMAIMKYQWRNGYRRQSKYENNENIGNHKRNGNE